VVRRLLAPLVGLVALVGAGVAILGRPDLTAAWRFFSGGVPTLYEGEAVMALLGWLVVLVVAAAGVGLTVNSAAGTRPLAQPLARATLLLAAGILLLGLALVRVSLPRYSMCCGSDAARIEEALRLVQR
jgi:hypothetical protein